MCTLLTAYSDLTQKAQALCDAFPYAEKLTAWVHVGTRLDTGKPFIQVQARFEQMGRGRVAELEDLGVYSPRLFAHTGMCADEDTALAELAAELCLENPFVVPVLASKEQRMEIVRLLNWPCITQPEKAKHLLGSLNLTEKAAAAKIIDLQRTINEREGHAVFPEVVQVLEPVYGVVGEAFLVQAEQAA